MVIGIMLSPREVRLGFVPAARAFVGRV